MESSPVNRLVGGSEEGRGIASTIEASNSARSNRSVYSSEEREELESREIRIKMQKMLSIWRNRDQEDEMHMTVFVDDQDYNRILEIQETENLRLAEAYDKMLEQKEENSSRSI